MLEMQATKEFGGAERKRVEAVVETLANLRGEGESLADVAHDARNMVTALGLYCDLLEEPGVLAPAFTHYGNELRLVATASRRLVEKLISLDCRQRPEKWGTPFGEKTGADSGDQLIGRIGPVRAEGAFVLLGEAGTASSRPSAALALGEATAASEAVTTPLQRSRRWDLMPAEPIANLAAELMSNRNLLAALAGPAIALTVDTEGGAQPVWLTNEDLTRVLVNLVKNAAEAMPGGGRIQLGLRERTVAEGSDDTTPKMLLLTVEDNGPGVSLKAIEKIFDSGFTTREPAAEEDSESVLKGDRRWSGGHRGLGLSITRSIIEGAGGRIHAVNRTPSGARFEIDLPLRTR